MHVYCESDRLLLRPIEKVDFLLILYLAQSPGWKQFMPTIRIESRAEAKDYIEHIHSTKGSYCHVIELRDNQQPIGIVGLNQRINEDYPDLGYAVVPDFEGFGYAFEACTLHLR